MDPVKVKALSDAIFAFLESKLATHPVAVTWLQFLNTPADMLLGQMLSSVTITPATIQAVLDTVVGMLASVLAWLPGAGAALAAVKALADPLVAQELYALLQKAGLV